MSVRTEAVNDPADDPAGLSRIGHYRLIGPIGRGGFSAVHHAIDERLDAAVAIKGLAENHALDPQIRERFLGEAQLLRKVACGAVIAVHDVGETGRRPTSCSTWPTGVISGPGVKPWSTRAGP
jgi:serine/threonine protein kinase